LFICAKDLFIEAVAAETHGADAYQHSRPWLARLAAMPEVLPVQFMQMLCGNGVKLRLDFAVADQRYGTNSAVPTIHNLKSPRRQFIVG